MFKEIFFAVMIFALYEAAQNAAQNAAQAAQADISTPAELWNALFELIAKGKKIGTKTIKDTAIKPLKDVLGDYDKVKQVIKNAKILAKILKDKSSGKKLKESEAANLYGVAKNGLKLVNLAGDEKALTNIAANETQIKEIVNQKKALLDLASQHSQLGELAGKNKALVGLAAQESQLGELAGKKKALIGLATQKSQLMNLAGKDTALLQLAGNATQINLLADGLTTEHVKNFKAVVQGLTLKNAYVLHDVAIRWSTDDVKDMKNFRQGVKKLVDLVQGKQTPPSKNDTSTTNNGTQHVLSSMVALCCLFVVSIAM